MHNGGTLKTTCAVNVANVYVKPLAKESDLANKGLLSCIIDTTVRRPGRFIVSCYLLIQEADLFFYGTALSDMEMMLIAV